MEVQSGRETSFLTSAGVLVSCNLSSHSKEQIKVGPCRGPGRDRRRGRRVTPKEEKDFIPFPVHY